MYKLILTLKNGIVTEAAQLEDQRVILALAHGAAGGGDCLGVEVLGPCPFCEADGYDEDCPLCRGRGWDVVFSWSKKEVKQ